MQANIGSHTLIELIAAGFTPVVYDNLSNSSPAFAGARPANCRAVHWVYRRRYFGHTAACQNLCRAWLHCGDSFCRVKGGRWIGCQATLVLSKQCRRHAQSTRCDDQRPSKNLIFSSSATVYGDPKPRRLSNPHQRSATNPYGQSKLMIEYMLETWQNR